VLNPPALFRAYHHRPWSWISLQGERLSRAAPSRWWSARDRRQISTTIHLGGPWRSKLTAAVVFDLDQINANATEPFVVRLHDVGRIPSHATPRTSRGQNDHLSNTAGLRHGKLLAALLVIASARGPTPQHRKSRCTRSPHPFKRRNPHDATSFRPQRPSQAFSEQHSGLAVTKSVKQRSGPQFAPSHAFEIPRSKEQSTRCARAPCFERRHLAPAATRHPPNTTLQTPRGPRPNASTIPPSAFLNAPRLTTTSIYLVSGPLTEPTQTSMRLFFADPQ